MPGVATERVLRVVGWCNGREMRSALLGTAIRKDGGTKQSGSICKETIKLKAHVARFPSLRQIHGLSLQISLSSADVHMPTRCSLVKNSVASAVHAPQAFVATTTINSATA